MKRSVSLFAAALLFAVMGNTCFASDPLTLSYAGGTGSGKSTSDYSENSWGYGYQYHILMLSGDLPQGKLFSQIQFEENKDLTAKTTTAGLAYARLSLSGTTYDMNIGDGVANFSDLTLRNLSYQGALITLKPTRTFSFTIVGGSRGNGNWGAQVRRDTRIKENFTGVRTVYYPGNGIGLSATYLTTPAGKDVLTYGTDYGIGDVSLGAEYGSATDGKAFRGEVKYEKSNFSLGTVYRDIDTTYNIPTDYVNYKGMKGLYSTLSYRPNNMFSINASSNGYLDRINSSNEAYISDNRGEIGCNLTQTTYVGYSGWRTDQRAYDRGGISDGEMMYITQQLFLVTKNAIYYRFQPAYFDSSVSGESYSEKKNVAGVNIALTDALRLNYEVENSYKLFRDTNIEIYPTAITGRVDLFESPIMDSAVSIASSANYRKDIPDKYSTPEATSQYIDVTLRYTPGSDLSCYITSKVLDIKAPDADRMTRQQNDISFGLNYSFNTYIYIK